MKVILLRDVAKIGRKGQVVELPDGYAQNQLIPKKWAQPASATNLKKVASLDAAAKAHTDAEQAQFATTIAYFTQQPLSVVGGDANAQGHLFKAVHEVDIIAAAKAVGVTLEKRWVTIEAPIKALGQHTIVLKHGTKTVPCVIEVISKS
jgi:large subunit ribosomal protein L9